jgi:rhamnosyltransferase
MRILDVKPGDYIPGRVLNMGMEATKSEIVAFVNADAVPLSPGAVETLVAPLRAKHETVATFARQVPRVDAARITVSDMERAFGDEAPVKTARGFFFSMAASAIRRSVWEGHPFNEALKYSEDVDWTYRMSDGGHHIDYVPEARFEHSHDYDPAGTWKRHHGEGVADTEIFGLGGPSLVRELARPLIGSVLRDARNGNLSGQNLRTRWQQATGYYAGRRESSL